MTVNHQQFGLMCEICSNGLIPEQCVVDTDGQKWDICKGDCARQAGVQEASTGTPAGRMGETTDGVADGARSGRV